MSSNETKRIYIADDDNIRQVVKTFLASDGGAVFEAESIRPKCREMFKRISPVN